MEEANTTMTGTMPSSSSSSSIGNSTGTGGASSILSDKVTRALQVRTDTPAMKAALEALARLPDSGEMDSRSVRVAIERDALQQALSLQHELETLVETVSSLRKGVADVATIAHDIGQVIHTNVVTPTNATTATTSTATLSTEDALEQELRLATLLSDAFQEQQEAKYRAEAINAFLEKFNLDPHYASLLDEYDFTDLETEGMHFLQALERVRNIRQELSSSDHHATFASSSQHDYDKQRIGSSSSLGATSAIRMMESLATKQERAYERLYHWLQSYLHLHPSSTSTTMSSQAAAEQQEQQQLDPDAMDEVLSHPFVRQSLITLSYVPALYSHTLELISTSRRVQVTKKFLLALTSGPSPMERKAHDPIAYVGDMLAFCFQSCSMEADNVRHIVVVVTDDENQQVAKEEEETTTTTLEDVQTTNVLTTKEMLAHAMSGMARPLKSRILQVVASLARKEGNGHDDDESDYATMHGHHDVDQDDHDDDEGAATRSRVSSLYDICGLLLFYHSALLKCVQQDANNPLVIAVMECLEEATQAYAASLCVYAAMLNSLSLVNGESEASLAQLLLGQLVQVRTTSPGFATHVPCPSELQSSLSLDFMTSTLVQAALSSCKTLDDAVTLKNCLSTLKKAGLTESYRNLARMTTDKEQALIDELVEEKTVQVLEVCGLASMANAWKNRLDVEGITMASQSGLSEEEVEMGMKEFYSSLYAPPLPTFENIKDPVLRRMARGKICDNVVHVYEELYNAMRSDKGGYDDLSFLGHTPEQVKTLFSA